ncbi:unnamed protein product [Owenia fusiformis]|uniref:Uncharacterized protein n=1 Tax=Owenia fusiformis TaxID=6347 RepID=A0A8J1U9L1_OWEFU|nr:unnamed protein product [Owenia fusiformis]
MKNNLPYVLVTMVMLLECSIEVLANCRRDLNRCRTNLANMKRQLDQCKKQDVPKKSCPKSFTYNAQFGSCYNFVIEEPTNWYNALSFCMAMGANLVDIETQAELNFIYSEIKQKGLNWPGSNEESFFTGGTRINGEWQWIGGESFDTKLMSFAPWVHGQGAKVNQLCHILWAPDSYKWHDRECTLNHRYICEIKLDKK